MSSKKKETEYVSCIRINGVPILPPVMTEERRKECRLYRQEAILVEKRLELARKEKELAEKMKLVDTLPSSPPKPSSDDEKENCSSKILNFILGALGDQNDAEGIQLLLDKVGKELHERSLSTSVSQSRCATRSSDCTSRDVEYISFNQIPESVHSSTLRDDSTYSEKSADETSLNGDCLYSESTFKNLQIDTPDDGNYPLNSIASIPVRSKYNEVNSNHNLFEELQEPSTSPILETESKNLGNSGDSDDDAILTEAATPTSAIRKNSYTLESPSPSVLAYLRNLTMASTSNKNIDTEANEHSNTSVNDLSKSKNESVSKSVVRNLNNFWDKNEVSEGKKPMVDISPEYKDSLEDDEDVCSIESDKNKNMPHRDKIQHIKLLENGNVKSPSPTAGVHSEVNSKQLRAAVTIQAYARGYLVRRLMKTHKVGSIKNVIKDAVLCAWSLYGEPAVTTGDLHLHEQIIQQVTAACYELHCIFFKWSTSEKMALISSDRERLKNPKPIPRIPRRRLNSESGSVRSISSRSSSRSNSSSVTQRSSRGATNETNLKRPSTLPSIPKSTLIDTKPWK